MTLARDLAWQNLDLVYRSSVAYQYARYALGLSYKLLPPEVIHQAKLCLLDALGNAIGAYDAPGRPMCEELAQELGGPKEATLFGSGIMTNVLSATLANSFLVRFLDYNDMGGGGHNEEAISGIIALSEREKASGRDLLTSIVISYELGARAAASRTGGGEAWGTKDFSIEFRGGLSMPPSLGKLMKMSEDQIANAIGLCASHSLPSYILDADREEFSMAKNLRFGWVVHDAILSCMLAKKGFTGPILIVEGDCGFKEGMFHGQMDLERMVDFSGWRILRTTYKSLCANGSTQGHIHATLGIVKENDVKPEDIASVRIRCSVREAHHTTTAAKKYPRNAESADHSAFYGNALAIKERAFGPESFDPKKFTDPVVLDLIEKITVEADPSLPGSGGISEITTKDGRRFQKRVDLPPMPVTDQELEDKFSEMATKYMSRKQIKDIFDTIWNIERLDNISALTRLMVFPVRKRR